MSDYGGVEGGRRMVSGRMTLRRQREKGCREEGRTYGDVDESAVVEVGGQEGQTVLVLGVVH